MKFNSDSAKMKFNGGMDKASLEQGYEVVPSEANFVGKVANKRLGLTDPWTECDSQMGGIDEMDD
jgi:hypothetical protein